MGITVIAAAISLVLVGLLFGFNIQVSASIVSVLNALGTIIGGVGAATAAFISYRSMGEWKRQFHHSKIYDSLSNIESILLKIFEQYEEEGFGDIGKDLKPLKVISFVARMISPYRKDYELNYNNIAPLLNSSQLVDFNKLNINYLAKELFDIYISYRQSNDVINSLITEDDKRSLQEMHEIHDDLKNTVTQMTKFHQLKTEYLQSLRDLKISL